MVESYKDTEFAMSDLPLDAEHDTVSARIYNYNLSNPPEQHVVKQYDSKTASPGTEMVAPADSVFELKPVDKLVRLIDIGNLPESELQMAQDLSKNVNFAESESLMQHGDGVMNRMSSSARKILGDVRLGDAGEAGRIAAAVLDGINILRIDDLRKEAKDGGPKLGVVGKVLRKTLRLKTAFSGFAENRKKFLTLMDEETAKARKTRADLAVSIKLMQEQEQEIKLSMQSVKLAIVAGQIALDRGEAELEGLRQKALQTGDYADAATVQSFRLALLNFYSKIGDMREGLVGSAMLIPLIAQNRSNAEIRMMKISTGIQVLVPRLMTVASQAAINVEINNAANSIEKMNVANRKLTELASSGARQGALSAMKSLSGDAANLDMLVKVADETIQTMNDVLTAENEVRANMLAHEQKLIEIKDKLTTGMQSVTQKMLEKPGMQSATQKIPEEQ